MEQKIYSPEDIVIDGKVVLKAKGDNKIKFYEYNHTYRILKDGFWRYIPGVTTIISSVEGWSFPKNDIMKNILDKLIREDKLSKEIIPYVKIVFKEYKKYMDNSIEIGNQAHLSAERYLKQDIPFIPEIDKANKFSEILKQQLEDFPDFHLLVSEGVLGSSEHNFTGTVDSIIMFAQDGVIKVDGGEVSVKKNDIAIIDFKTGAPLVDERLQRTGKTIEYDDKLRKVSKQIGGYSILLKENYEIPRDVKIHGFCLSAFEKENFHWELKENDSIKVYDDKVIGGEVYYLPIIETVEEKDFLSILKIREVYKDIKKRKVYYGN